MICEQEGRPMSRKSSLSRKDVLRAGRTSIEQAVIALGRNDVLSAESKISEQRKHLENPVKISELQHLNDSL